MAKKEFVYEHIMNAIASKIENNEYKNGQLLPPEREIAELYQANRTTVRKALQLLEEKGYIAKKQGSGNMVIYQKVLNAVETDTPSERTIGFFLPGGTSSDIRIDQPFYMSLYFYIELTCRQQNCRVVCITLMDLEEFKSIIDQYSISGAFFMAKMEPSILEYAVSLGIPSVCVNNKYPNIPCITMDNVNGGYLATKHLLENGHRKIALITGPDSYFTSEDRKLGALKAMSEFQQPMRKEYIASADWTFNGGYHAMKKLLNETVDNRPTAVFAFNGELTHGAAKAITESGLSIPEQISVIGFENISVSRYRNAISMIDGNINQMAKTISTLLLNSMDGRGLNHDVTVMMPVYLLDARTVQNIN